MSFGAFNKKSSTTQTSNTKSTGLNFSEVGGSASAATIDGSNNSTSITNFTTETDAGSIAGAFKFAGTLGDRALRTGENALGDAFDFGKSTLDEGFDFGRDAFKQSIDFAKSHDSRQMDVLERLVDTGGSLFEAAASQADTNGHQQKLILYVAGAFVLVFAIQLLKK